MIEIKGISLETLPFQIGNKIGTLLYQEFPVTTIYSNGEDYPIIREWVDCEGKVDKYFLYRTTKENLKSFIDGDISQQELIINSINKIGFIVDERNKKIESIKIISTSQLPIQYLPPYDSFFIYEDGVDTEKIVQFFNLDSLKIIPINLDGYLKELALNKKSEIFNIHLKEGQGVRLGRVDTDILGSTLLNFDTLYKEIVLDYYYGKNRGETQISPKEKKEKLLLVSTEVFTSKAASFSVYLKPKFSSQIDLFQSKTETEAIAESLFNLFKISKTEDSLKEHYLNYSDFVFNKYKKFLSKITQFDFNLDLNWTNQPTTSFLKEDFNLKLANDIINLIKKISTSQTENFKIKGKFRAINCDTRYFTFESLENEQYYGYFDKKIVESIFYLTFTNLYEISIDRTTRKEAGDFQSKISDTIVATYKMEE